MTVRFHSNLNNFQSIFKRNIKNTLKELGEFGKSRLDIHAAIDTGFMKSRNRYKIINIRKVRIGNFGCEYNIYQEYGTYKMNAHPFVRPSAFNYSSYYRIIGINGLSRGLRG